jgi:hypothetical protein
MRRSIRIMVVSALCGFSVACVTRAQLALDDSDGGLGVDANSGLTMEAPWLTLSKAAQATPNDSVCFIRGEGTLADAVVTAPARTGYMMFKPKSGGAPVLGAITLSNAKFTHWNGFTHSKTWRVNPDATDHRLTLATFAGLAQASGTPVVLASTASSACARITIEDSDLRPWAPTTGTTAGQKPISTSASTSTALIADVVIRRCKIHGVNNEDAIQINRAQNWILEDNDFYDHIRTNVGQDGTGTEAHPDMIQQWLPNAGTIIIRRNKFHNEMNASRPTEELDVTPIRIDGYDSADCTYVIEDNLFYANFFSADVSVYNATSIIMGNRGPAGMNIGGTGSCRLFGNIGYKFAKFDTVALLEDYNVATEVGGSAGFQGFAKGPNSRNAQPAYVSPGSPNYDYRLASGDVVAKDLGAMTFNGVTRSSTDRLGRPRPVGTADIGCYERQTTDP